MLDDTAHTTLGPELHAPVPPAVSYPAPLAPTDDPNTTYAQRTAAVIR